MKRITTQETSVMYKLELLSFLTMKFQKCKQRMESSLEMTDN